MSGLFILTFLLTMALSVFVSGAGAGLIENLTNKSRAFVWFCCYWLALFCAFLTGVFYD